MYLAVDNDGRRRERYLRSNPFVDVVNDVESMAGVDAGFLKDLSKYDAAIVDFHLDYHGKAADSPIRLRDGTPVTTGIGVMAWLREKRPDLPLFAATGRGFNHAPWFMCGAYRWLGAPPLDVHALGEDIDGNPSHALRDLISADSYKYTSLFEDTLQAAEHFNDLLNTSLENGVEMETLRWLGLFARLGSTYVPPVNVITQAVRDSFNAPDYEAHNNRIPGQLYRMQRSIAGMWYAFGYESHADGWPEVDADERVSTLTKSFYESGCPVLQEIQDPIVKLFVTAPDVLKVHLDHRARLNAKR